MTSKDNIPWSLLYYGRLVCVLIGSLTVTQSLHTAPSPSPQGPQPYCVPEVWQGGRMTTLAVVSKSGESTVKRSFGNVIYSARQQKMVMEDNLYDKGGHYIRRIFDYPDKVLYTIRGSETQRCTRSTLGGPFVPQCVPGDSTVTLVNSTYGTGNNTVSVMELSGTQGNVSYRVSLTPDTHVPVYERLWGDKEGDRLLQTLSFYNVSISSTDFPPVMFKPPDICLHPSPTPPQMVERSADDMQRPMILGLMP